MSDQSAGYNPMSYHDGSVWPHDNSMCLLGLSSSGFHDEANQVIEGLMKSVEGFEHYRLPELFCGYSADQGMPVPYPVACSPQAWAAGTPLVFMQVILGIKPDAAKKSIKLNPSLPNGVNELTIDNLFVAQGRLSLTIKRQANSALTIDITANTTGYQIESGQPTAAVYN
jgi:glycogen debranching enzyme